VVSCRRCGQSTKKKSRLYCSRICYDLARKPAESRREYQRRWDASWRASNRIAARKKCQLWRLNNPERVRACRKKWQTINRGRILQGQRDWRRKNPRRMAGYAKRYYRSQEQFRLRVLLRVAMRQCLRRSGLRKSSSAMSLLGCSIDDFKIYLESLFEPGRPDNLRKGIKCDSDHAQRVIGP
jgi:hypothetical protein